MKSITVLGWYNKNNIGDESYKLAFPLVFNNCKFSFTDKIGKNNHADEYILGGGDILAEEMIDQILSFNKPAHIVSASANTGIDPEKLKKFKSIIVRDAKSIAILKDKGINAHYAPDVAFALKPNKENGEKLIKKAFKQQKRDLYQKVVVVVVNGYLIDNHQTNFDVRRFLNFQQLSYELGHLMDFTNASFLFVPFGQEMPWDDRVANMWVAQKAKFWKKNAFIHSEPNAQNVLDIIAASDAVISSRLHSTIFAMTAGTPFVDITHNHKNKWLLETTNMKHLSVSYFGFEDDKIKEKLNDLILNRDVHSKELSNLLDKQRALLGELQDVCQLR